MIGCHYWTIKWKGNVFGVVDFGQHSNVNLIRIHIIPEWGSEVGTYGWVDVAGEKIKDIIDSNLARNTKIFADNYPGVIEEVFSLFVRSRKLKAFD